MAWGERHTKQKNRAASQTRDKRKVVVGRRDGKDVVRELNYTDPLPEAKATKRAKRKARAASQAQTGKPQYH